MRLSNRLTVFVVLLTLLAGGIQPAGLLSAASAAQSAPWQDKVDPWVLETAAQGETEFLVFLREQADLSAAARLETKEAKGRYVFETLRQTASRTQGPLLAELARLGAAYRSYWVANMVWVRGGPALIEALARRGDVLKLYANPTVHFDGPIEQAAIPAPDAPEAIEWNILKVRAEQVWAAGYTGQGVVIGGQDTGYDWDHPALQGHYRGWNGAAADHNYSWHDAIHTGGVPSCPANSTVPCDDHGHGTHTMGTMVGEDASKTNQIGMAPGAKWIGCRNMDSGNGTPTTYSECYQWFIAPTDLNGQNPDPTKAPHVINNSWGCPASEGCTDPNVLLTVVTNVRAAGILTVHSAGNDGSSCSSVNTPAAIYAQSFSVGATDSSDTIAGFSSRGPVTVDGSNRMKPNISAPGVGIRSSTPGTGYGSLSGTSMAGPHVAGLAALIMSAAPGLKGQVDTLEDVMEQTAIPRTSAQTCGGVPGSQVPNNTYGWGRIDALNAFNNVNAPHTLALKKLASTLTASPGGLITYTLTVTHPHPSAPTTNLVLNDVVPANSSFVSATPPYTRTGPIVSWQKASLGPQSTWQVQMVVRVQAGASGSVVNSNYGVYSSQVPLVSGSPVSTTIAPQTLHLLKTAASSAIAGQPLTYTLTVTNPASMGAAHNLILTDTLPAGTTFHGASPGYTLNNGIVTWTAPLLNPGAVWSVQLGVTTPLTATGGVTNTHYAVHSSETPGGVRGPQVATQLQPAYALQFSVDGAPSQTINPGWTIQAVFSITNTGALTDTYTLTLTSLQGWSTSSWSGPVTLGPGENGMVVAYVTIPPTAPGGSKETATVDVVSAGSPALTASAEKIITVNYVVHLPVMSK